MAPLSLICLFFSALLLPGCGGPSAGEKQAAFETIRKNVEYLQNEQLDEIMQTIHPQSPAFEVTRSTMKELMEKVDLRYEVSDLTVVSAAPDEMRVRFTQITRKVGGKEPFPSTKVLGTHVLRRDQDQWKIFNTEVMHSEDLDPAEGKPSGSEAGAPGTPAPTEAVP